MQPSIKGEDHNPKNHDAHMSVFAIRAEKAYDHPHILRRIFRCLMHLT